MQLQIGTPEIKIVYEQQLFNSKNFHVFIYNKTGSISGLYQHDYYEFTPVPTGRHYQGINGKRVLPERGNFASVPLGSRHQSFYDSNVTKIPNVGISKRFPEQHYHPLLPLCFVASQVYRANDSFLIYTGTIIASLNFRESGLDEFVEVVTFYTINRLCHHHEEQALDDIPQQFKTTVETMHGKRQSGENTLESMVHLFAKSQKYLTRATQRYYGKTPMQITNEVRINFAKKQLEATNYSVADIAYEPGYSSPSLFTKTLKEPTSFTLSGYRKRLIEFNQ